MMRHLCVFVFAVAALAKSVHPEAYQMRKFFKRISGVNKRTIKYEANYAQKTGWNKHWIAQWKDKRAGAPAVGGTEIEKLPSALSCSKDAKGNVTISEKELQFTIKTLSAAPLILEIDDFMNAFEADTVAAGVAAQVKPKKEKNMNFNLVPDVRKTTNKLFYDFDDDGNGYISKEEFHLNVMPHFIADSIPPALSAKVWGTWNVDSNEDGHVSLTEYRQNIAENRKFLAAMSELEQKKGKIFTKNVRSKMEIESKTDAGLVIEVLSDRLKELMQHPTLTSETVHLFYHSPGDHVHAKYLSGVKDASVSTNFFTQQRNAPCCDTREAKHVRTRECHKCVAATAYMFFNDAQGGELAFPAADRKEQDVPNRGFLDEEDNNLSLYCDKAGLKVAPKKGKLVLVYHHMQRDFVSNKFINKVPPNFQKDPYGITMGDLEPNALVGECDAKTEKIIGQINIHGLKRWVRTGDEEESSSSEEEAAPEAAVPKKTDVVPAEKKDEL